MKWTDASLKCQGGPEERERPEWGEWRWGREGLEGLARHRKEGNAVLREQQLRPTLHTLDSRQAFPVLGKRTQKVKLNLESWLFVSFP